MALARIISNSDLCSRELAINLLERGYAVEIVSPDAIPDNIADLEVRVETGPADLLSASVEVRGGSHSSTLQFIHQLKTPSLDMKRPAPVVMPEEGSDIAIPALAIAVNPPRTTDLVAVSDAATADIPIPALAIPANPPRTVDLCEPIPVSTTALAPAIKPRIIEAPDVNVVPSIKTAIVEKPEAVAVAENPGAGTASADPPKKPAAFSEGASLIVMPSPSQEAAQKIAQPGKSEVGIHSAAVFKVIIPKPSIPSLTIPKFQLASWRGLFTRSKDWVSRVAARPASWFGWTALGFAGLMTLGLSLELVSLRMSHSSHDAGSKVATANATIDGFSLLAPVVDSNKNNVVEKQIKSPVISQSSVGNSAVPRSAPPVSRRDTEQSVSAPKSLGPSPTSKAGRSAHKATPRVNHSDDLIAPDTITYFNRSGAKPVPVNQPASQHDSRKRGQGVNAANSAAAKTASQTGSGK